MLGRVGGQIMIEVYDSLERMGTLEPLWRGLETNPAMRGFQTYAWNHAAAESCAARGRLAILRWYSPATDDQVIFPGWIDGKGNLRFLGDDVGDVGGCVFGRSSVNRIHAYREFAEWVEQRRNIRRVWLQKLDAEGEPLRYFSTVFHGAMVFKDHLRGQLTSFRTEDFIGGQTHLRPKERSRLRGIVHRSKGMRLQILKDPNRALADLRNVADFMIEQGWRSARWFDGRILGLAEAMMAAGWMEAAELVNDDGVQVIGLRIVKDGQSDAWICGYREKDLLSSLYVRYMEEKVKTGDWRFDFGVGAYNYKWQSFRPEPRVSFTLRYSKSRLGKLWDFVRMNVRVGRNMVGR